MVLIVVVGWQHKIMDIKLFKFRELLTHNLFKCVGVILHRGVEFIPRIEIHFKNVNSFVRERYEY